METAVAAGDEDSERGMRRTVRVCDRRFGV